MGEIPCFQTADSLQNQRAFEEHLVTSHSGHHAGEVIKTSSSASKATHSPVPVTLQEQSLKNPLPVTLISQSLQKPILVQNAGGPDWVSISAIILAALAVIVAIRQAHLAKKDLKTSLEALKLQLEALAPKPSFEFRANGESHLLKARREFPIDIELFIVNNGSGRATPPLQFEVAIPTEWNITGIGENHISPGTLQTGRIPGYPGQYRLFSTPTASGLESDTAAFLGILGKSYIPKGRYFLLSRVIEGSKRHAYSRIVVECEYP